MKELSAQSEISADHFLNVLHVLIRLTRNILEFLDATHNVDLDGANGVARVAPCAVLESGIQD